MRGADPHCFRGGFFQDLYKGVPAGFGAVLLAVERVGASAGIVMNGVGAGGFNAGCCAAMGFDLFSRADLYFSHTSQISRMKYYPISS